MQWCVCVRGEGEVFQGKKVGIHCVLAMGGGSWEAGKLM